MGEKRSFIEYLLIGLSVIAISCIAAGAKAGGTEHHDPSPPTQGGGTVSGTQSQQQAAIAGAISGSNSNANSKATGGAGGQGGAGGMGGQGGNANGGAVQIGSLAPTATGGTSSAQGGSAGSDSSSSASGGVSKADASGGNASGQSASYYSSAPRQTPPAFAGTVQPTASCRGALNGGASSPIAAISFGVSRDDKECDLREVAREFFEMGRPDLGVALLCQSEAAQRLASCAPADDYQGEGVQIEEEKLEQQRASRAAAHGFPKVNK